MNTEDPDVLIIGCGPVGMVLAGLLATAGIRVLAIEREPELGRRPRARHIDAEAMRVLQTIGVAEATEQTMRPLGGFRLVDAAGRALLEQPGDNSRPGEQGWIPDYQMFQPLLLQILLDHLRADDGVEVRPGCEAVALEQHEDHVRVTVVDRAAGTTETISAQYVVGCDGADSGVRELIAARFRSLGPDHPYLVIDATPLRPDFELPEPTLSLNVCDPARPHYVSPGSEQVPTRFEFMVMPGDDPGELVSAQGISRLTARYLKDGDVHFDRAAVYVFHSLLVDDWRTGRVLLAGDAAHVQPPFPMRWRLRRGLGYGWCEGSVIVAMDPLGPESDALQTGIRLALQQSSRLVLLALVSDPSHWMHCSGVATPWTWQSVREQSIEETARACDRLVERVPSGVPVSFAVACGRAERIIDQLVADTASSQLVLARADFKHRPVRGWDRAGVDLYAV